MILASRNTFRREKKQSCDQASTKHISAFNATQQNYSHPALTGYVTIRNKLIAHNELRKSDAGYAFFDIKVLDLKYGQERKTLEMARDVVDDLDLLVRNSSFVWDSFLNLETEDVCRFWGIEEIEPAIKEAKFTPKPR